MKTHNLNILLATNGCEDSCPALDYGIWLAAVIQAKVTLLGVIETSQLRQSVESLVDLTAQRLADLNINHLVEFRSEDTREALRDLITRGSYDLLVIGRLGRPTLWRWLKGRSFRHIMADLDLPILYIPDARIPAKKVLVCLGGLGYTFTVERLGLDLARAMGADVTLLHVVAPIDLDYPPAQAVKENWDHLLETDTLLGRTLREGLASARAADIEAVLKVRQGNIIEEILKEIKEGNYDLTCMGSPHSVHALRQLYLPNVTAEVAEVTKCPILTARYNPQSINPE